MLTTVLKYATGGLLFVCLILGIALSMERTHSAKLAKRNTELTAELKRISTAKNNQREATKGSIAKAEQGREKAEVTAKRIEAAPSLGLCKTPAEIMGADL